MANPNSERVQKQRKQNYDRISVLIEKDGKYLVKALALREGVSIAEAIRRAIIARAGLRMLPYSEDMKKFGLPSLETKEDADAAILRLQAHEESSEILQKVLQELAPEPDAANYNMKIDHDTRCVLLRLAGYTDSEIAEMLKNRWGEEQNITASGFDVGHLRRMLANIQHIDAK